MAASMASRLARDVSLAHVRLQSSTITRVSPLELSLSLSAPSNSAGVGHSGHEVLFKCDHLQPTGSFKLRGATNKLMLNLDKARDQGVFTASTGNHALAVSWAARRLNIRAHVFIPETTDPSKVAALKCLDSQVTMVGNNCVVAETEAQAAAASAGTFYISPYNDWEIMAGQGTAGQELVQQCRQLDDDGHSEHTTEVGGSHTSARSPLDAVFVSVGGGGLVAGMGAAIKAQLPQCLVYGVQPAHSQVMFQSVQAGRILQDVEEFPTLSDGTAGGIEENSVTFDLCRDPSVVDQYVLCSEAEIANALKYMFAEEHMYVEGSAALALAGYMQLLANGQLPEHVRRVAILLCGRNVAWGRVLSAIGDL